MTTLYKNYNEVQSFNDYGQQACTQIYTASLAATTDTTLTVPGGGIMGGISATTTNGMIAVIRVENNTWVALNQTAAVPAGATFAASGSELVTSGQSMAKVVDVGDVIHFYTATAGTDVSVAFYALSA